MKLIGIVTGSYEGHMFSKLILTEKMDKDGCIGENAVISRCNYEYCISDLIPMGDLIIGKDVSLYYDRFGKVQKLEVLS